MHARRTERKKGNTARFEPVDFWEPVAFYVALKQHCFVHRCHAPCRPVPVRYLAPESLQKSWSVAMRRLAGPCMGCFVCRCVATRRPCVGRARHCFVAACTAPSCAACCGAPSRRLTRCAFAVCATRYSEQSDVWAFGVLCWELLTDGNIPYYEITLMDDVSKFVLAGGK